MESEKCCLKLKYYFSLFLAIYRAVEKTTISPYNNLKYIVLFQSFIYNFIDIGTTLSFSLSI